jgi:sialic acid synthase SpsE
MMIIAEIGTAHGGSEQKMTELIDAAVAAGADAVKFQWVYADEILHPDTGFVTLPGGATRLYDRFRELEVRPEFYEHAASYAHEKGVSFICSPFGIRSLHELLDLHPDAVKIASPELNHQPLLQELAAYRTTTAVPVILSGGVSTLADIEAAVSLLGREQITFLHCITSYPAPETEYNLRLIETLSAVLGIPCGVSDHSLDPVLIPVLSAAMGGTIVEKHITLSRKTDGLDDPVALEPEQFAHMTYCVRQAAALLHRYGPHHGREQIIHQMEDEYGAEKVTAVLGDGVKRLAPSERANYGRTNRSIHVLTALPRGTVLTADMLGILRTEKILTPGLSPCFLNDVLGTVLTRDVSAGAGLSWNDVTTRGQRGA